MVEQKKKMRLEELHIASFVTTNIIPNDQTLEIAGGGIGQFLWDYVVSKAVDASLAGQCNPGTWAGSMNGQCGTSYP